MGMKRRSKKKLRSFFSQFLLESYVYSDCRFDSNIKWFYSVLLAPGVEFVKVIQLLPPSGLRPTETSVV